MELNSGMPTAGINLLWLLIAVIVDLAGWAAAPIANRGAESRSGRYPRAQEAAFATSISGSPTNSSKSVR